MVGNAIANILSGVTQNIFPGEIPHRPGAEWVIYTMISHIPNNTKDGTDYDQYRFQLDTYARQYPDMDTKAEAVRTAMDGYQGTAAGVKVDNIFLDNSFETMEEIITNPGDRGEKYWRRSQDYIIFIKK